MLENYTIAEGARISIVDDDESMREAMKVLIGSMGLDVEGFSSAEAFLNSGRSQRRWEECSRQRPIGAEVPARSTQAS